MHPHPLRRVSHAFGRRLILLGALALALAMPAPRPDAMASASGAAIAPRWRRESFWSIGCPFDVISSEMSSRWFRVARHNR